MYDCTPERPDKIYTCIFLLLPTSYYFGRKEKKMSFKGFAEFYRGLNFAIVTKDFGHFFGVELVVTSPCILSRIFN